MTTRVALFLSTIVTIAIVHIVSIEFFLYWKYLWLDIPMHILGGVACAFAFSILPFFHLHISSVYSTRRYYILFAFIVGFLWEVFEYSAGISVGEPGFVIDTCTDLVMDVFGAYLGYGVIQGTNTITS